MAIFIFAMLFFSCNEIQSPPHEIRTGLFAKISAAKTEFHSLNEAKIQACVKNYGPGDTTINQYVLENPILAIEVKDDSGHALLSFPPPVPPLGLNEYNRVLHPGDSVLFNYKLDIFVLPERKGNYRIRLRGINSDELIVKVK